MLLALSQAMGTPVSTLLGETVPVPEADDVKAIAEKLELVNLQLARRSAARRRMLRWLCIALCALSILVFAALAAGGSAYLRWNLHDPETAVFAAAFHVFEWLFVRLAPLILVGGAAGIVLTRKKD